MFRTSINKLWLLSCSKPTVNVVGKVPLLHCAEKRCISVSTVFRNRNSKTATGEEDEDLDKPIQFTTSKASKFSAQETLGGNPFPNAPWYQPYVVMVSVGMFLLYFLALREENDIDEVMSQPLWERVPGLEKQQLLVVLDYNRSHDLDTIDIERRLEELKKLELKESQGIAKSRNPTR